MMNGKFKCLICGHDESERYIDYNGYGYETYLRKCLNCGKITVVGYREWNNFDINNDIRYYTYYVEEEK